MRPPPMTTEAEARRRLAPLLHATIGDGKGRPRTVRQWLEWARNLRGDDASRGQKKLEVAGLKLAHVLGDVQPGDRESKHMARGDFCDHTLARAKGGMARSPESST